MVDEADELYGLPDDEFTAARDALAKRLRGEKRREEADEVKALRRPNVAAARDQPSRARARGRRPAGRGRGAARGPRGAAVGQRRRRRASARPPRSEREAVRDFARLALGDGASASTEDKVRATLHAASVDDDVRDAARSPGRLERDAEAGADPMAMLAPGRPKSRGSGATRRPSPKPAPGGPLASRSRSPKPDRSGGGKRSGPSEAEQRRAKAAERAQEAADRALTAQAEAETAAERARATLDEAEEAARKARAVVEDLEGARARGAPRAQGGRGRGRAPPHRGPAGGQGRRVARLAVAFRQDVGGAVAPEVRDQLADQPEAHQLDADDHQQDPGLQRRSGPDRAAADWLQAAVEVLALDAVTAAVTAGPERREAGRA